MPLSRNPRMDRRRRTIRENLSVVGDGSDENRVSPSRATRSAEIAELTKKERGAAYSHSVRKACQHRLVEFIPVRKLSLTGAVAASLTIPFLLIALHYLIFVSGTLDWSGHPMSALLNANSPRSLAAWLSSHLWLLCLGSTVLTFRLRKHKLDDYDGEYRLWFWLVFTCVIGSIDSTTRLTELFGAALDRWSQLHVGWSGGAIVQATLATLIGMLGLRLCSELKSVPTSLVLWLVGLVLWAGSAALSQSLLQLDMSPAVRSWLRAALWLGGLTSIWLCSLYFLRATFMEAQKRFLSRALSSANSVPWQQRLREAMPTVPKFSFRRTKVELDEVQEEPKSSSRKRKPRPAEVDIDQAPLEDAKPQPSEPAQAAKRGWGLSMPKLALRPPKSSSSAPTASDPSDEDTQVEREYGKKPGWFSKRKAEDTSESAPAAKRTLKDRLTWSRKRNAEEPRQSDDDATETKRSKRSWLKISRPKLPKLSIPKPRLPKLKLPSFRLPPPGENADPTTNPGPNSVPSTSQSRPLPSTSSSSRLDTSNSDDQESENTRGLSKAERKRLKRMQQENERRAA